MQTMLCCDNCLLECEGGVMQESGRFLCISCDSKQNGSIYGQREKHRQLPWIIFIGVIVLWKILPDSSPRQATLDLNDQRRLREIQATVMDSKAPVEPKLKEEFFCILKKGQIPIARMVEDNTHVRIWNQQFWADALISYRTGTPYKSIERENEEIYIIKKGILPKKQFDENNSFITKIAFKIPVGEKGAQHLIDEKIISITSKNSEAAIDRLKDLYKQ